MFAMPSRSPPPARRTGSPRRRRGREYRLTREAVDEVELITAWKDGTSLLDPLDQHPGVVTLSQLRAGIQVDRPRNAPTQYGTTRQAG
jgi:hypothetical protein